MQSILLVDPHQDVAIPLQSAIRAVLGPEWELCFANSGNAAWAMVQKSPFDVVVVNWSMPDMPGSELLFKIMHRNPETIRIAFSDQRDEGAMMRSLGAAHQHLVKPLAPAALRDSLSRVIMLRSLLSNSRLERLVANVLSLPSVPDLYLELLKELRSKEPSVSRIGEIVMRDIGMCTKLLQFANSAFFGHASTVTDPAEAVAFLGLENVKGLVLSLQIFSLYERSKFKNFSFAELWSHSWGTATIARQLAEFEGSNQAEANEAFIAGLLHDVGKLVLATGLQSTFESALALQAKENIPFWQAEQQTIGCTHAEVGGYLLGLWGFPPDVVEAAAFHHVPSKSRVDKFGPLAAVHVANVLHHAQARGTAESQLDFNFLSRIGMSDRFDIWKKEISGSAESQ